MVIPFDLPQRTLPILAYNLTMADLNMPPRILAVGEVLWDIFETVTRLGGAPLNFCAHAQQLGCDPRLISAVGNDELGCRTIKDIAALGLNTKFLQQSSTFATGTARVHIGPGDQTRFSIVRPVAYDAVDVSGLVLQQLSAWAPNWLYYGTLFSCLPQGKSVLDELLAAFPACSKFYDLNLRSGFDSPSLVTHLLAFADVVKLNEEELAAVHEFIGLAAGVESFCRQGSERFGWKAVCVTMGSRGCAVWDGGQYAEAPGSKIQVADPVGAGDAFAAAFLYGLSSQWPAPRIASFANRVGALVASRHGAIPYWTMAEAELL